jgi:hypothetical protein
MQNLTINLNARLQPIHRHDIEDALQATLERISIDAEITGGGSSQEANGEVKRCDIELLISDGSDENLKKIVGIMESMLAPVGSKLIIHGENDSENRTVRFGFHQGLGLYLNGKDLDNSIYEDCDVNFVYQEIERLLGDFQVGHIASYWEGEETSFYLYGRNFDEMHKRIKPLLDEYPLCQKCRVVQIA